MSVIYQYHLQKYQIYQTFYRTITIRTNGKSEGLFVTQYSQQEHHIPFYQMLQNIKRKSKALTRFLVFYN